MMNLLKVAIVGGRDFADLDRVVEDMTSLMASKGFPKTEILCGEARGADTQGRLYGEMLGFTVKSYPAKWNEYGKSAGYRRNAEMAKDADVVLAYWDGVSKGTKHMIDLTKKKGKQLELRDY
jgi:hypothetical protein